MFYIRLSKSQAPCGYRRCQKTSC